MNIINNVATPTVVSPTSFDAKIAHKLFVSNTTTKATLMSFHPTSIL